MREKRTLWCWGAATPGILLATCVWAVQPLAPPSFYKTCDATITYCAAVDPDQGTSVYQVDRSFHASLIYQVRGWYREFFLSEDSRYAAIGHGGLGRVWKDDATEATVILTILKNGERHHEVRLGDIIEDMSSLEELPSHYRWGRNKWFFANGTRFLIETVEDTYMSVDAESGEVSMEIGPAWE